jgi:eukaryotic translation initiation factor 2C
VISALNVILAAHPSRISGGGVMVGRNKFFFPSDDPISLGGGLEAWRGFYSSVRVAHKQLMVNVNACTTAFYTPGNLADAMITASRATFGASLGSFVRTIRVQTTHLGYRKTVKSLSKQTPKEYKFDCAEFGGMISVEDYFRRSKWFIVIFRHGPVDQVVSSEYQITLRHPDLPLVDVGGQKANLLPPEVCEILPGQHFRGRFSDDQAASMIKVACRPANANAGAIVGPGLTALGFRQGSGPLNAFGLSISTEMAVVPGRLLPAPGIKYAQGSPRVDERASWNLRDVKFEVGGQLDNWAVLLIKDGHDRDEFRDTNDPELRQVIQGFASMCRKCGMRVGNADPKFVSTRLPPGNRTDPTRRSAIFAIRDTLRGMGSKPTLVLVILSNGDKHIYSGLKSLCDGHLAVPTVCVHASKIRKSSPQYFANVALKVNMKMGGVNHGLDQGSMEWLKKVPTMLVGMDVTHPGPRSVKGTVGVHDFLYIRRG